MYRMPAMNTIFASHLVNYYFYHYYYYCYFYHMYKNMTFNARFHTYQERDFILFYFINRMKNVNFNFRKLNVNEF